MQKFWSHEQMKSSMPWIIRMNFKTMRINRIVTSTHLADDKWHSERMANFRCMDISKRSQPLFRTWFSFAGSQSESLRCDKYSLCSLWNSNLWHEILYSLPVFVLLRNQVHRCKIHLQARDSLSCRLQKKLRLKLRQLKLSLHWDCRRWSRCAIRRHLQPE